MACWITSKTNSVLYKMGDLFSDFGEGEEARRAFAESLAIRERRAQAELIPPNIVDDLVKEILEHHRSSNSKIEYRSQPD
jgi:hypothetical protein